MIHSDAARAEALGLALALGADEAAHRTGIPRRTISRWLADPRRVEEASDPSTHEAIVGKLWHAVEVGTDAVLAGLQDPKARLGDKARALEVVSTRHAMLTGAATSRSEVVGRDPDNAAVDDLLASLSWEESAIVRRAFDDALERVLAARDVTLAPVDPRRLTDGNGSEGPADA
ncbi:MAG: hypothetical protein AB1736_00055 [Chloroflexota bacterium]